MNLHQPSTFLVHRSPTRGRCHPQAVHLHCCTCAQATHAPGVRAETPWTPSLGLAIAEVSRRRSPPLGRTRPRFSRTALAAASQSPLGHGATLRAAQCAHRRGCEMIGVMMIGHIFERCLCRFCGLQAKHGGSLCCGGYYSAHLDIVGSGRSVSRVCWPTSFPHAAGGLAWLSWSRERSPVRHAVRVHSLLWRTVFVSDTFCVGSARCGRSGHK